MGKVLSDIDILGVTYSVRVQDEKENPKLNNADGLCEIYAKQLIIDDSNRNDKNSYMNINEYYQQILRHEVFHAIFAECGANDYCRDEKLIDMLAFLYPRIEKIMQETKKIGDEINAL